MRLSLLLPVLASVFVVSTFPVRADDSLERYDWQLDETYAGSHMDDFNRLRYEIPILMRQSQIDIAVATGLDFQEGWTHPLIIQFVDGSSGGVEYELAFVQRMTE